MGTLGCRSLGGCKDRFEFFLSRVNGGKAISLFLHVGGLRSGECRYCHYRPEY